MMLLGNRQSGYLVYMFVISGTWGLTFPAREYSSQIRLSFAHKSQSTIPPRSVSDSARNKTQSNTQLPIAASHDVLPREQQPEVASVYPPVPCPYGKPSTLMPRVSIGRRRENVSLVIGVPTVRRPTRYYIEQTLDSLLLNLNEHEENDVVVIVMVADITNLHAADVSIAGLQSRYAEYIDRGVLEIIAPPVNYYPNLDAVPPSLGDDPQRVRWRAKQVLDFAYLMTYGHTKGTHYLQLEDDVVTKPGYVTKITNFVAGQEGYLMLEFSSLGFIGKLFKAAEVPRFVRFLLLFYETKPVDWLLANYLFVKVCLGYHETKYCPKALEKPVQKFNPSLFQHMGVESSLQGKMQYLRERGFGKVQLFVPHKRITGTGSSLAM